MPPKRRASEMTENSEKTEIIPLQKIREAVEQKKKDINVFRTSHKMIERRVAANDKEIEEYRKMMERCEDLKIINKRNLEVFQIKICDSGNEIKELEAIQNRGEELEKKLLGSAKKELADNVESMLRERQEGKNTLLQTKYEAESPTSKPKKDTHANGDSEYRNGHEY
ncbi:hypothetical protein SBOR_2582 [Sclerotinia borealis F-4128]|uniref:Uncharacterized protein n=1 Tax=Sclerotinia borealis (strain F-4128) TaxID=1432307 RepID=W9CJS5_SCLBF|nr:hypothetical protein SBOR_2582 [Sclerotinia borealis F-4128]